MAMPVAEMEMMRIREDVGGKCTKTEFVDTAVLVDIWIEPWAQLERGIEVMKELGRHGL